MKEKSGWCIFFSKGYWDIKKVGKSMSERDIFMMYIPQIADMIVLLSHFSKEEFEMWKNEVIDSADERSKEFIKKVITIIEKMIKGKE